MPKHLAVRTSAAHRGYTPPLGDDLTLVFEMQKRRIQRATTLAVTRCRKRQLLAASEHDDVEVKPGSYGMGGGGSHYGRSANGNGLIEDLATKASE